MKILIANIGSTSFKYRRLEREMVLAQGKVERIGSSGGDCPDYDTAIRRCLDGIVGDGKPLAALADLSGVGFKVVRAGPLGGARMVDETVLKTMEERQRTTRRTWR